MLSALPKLADRNFVLGFFLPSLLFTLGGLALFSDHPKVRELVADLAAKDVKNAAFLLVGVWVLGVLMLAINHPLYRILEGYCWPFSRLTRRRERYQARLRAIQQRLATLYGRWRVERDAFPQADIDHYRDLKQELARTLPSLETDVQPTSFGNAIKAFETYPRDVYGADGPPIWLRLITVMPKDVLAQIQEVRTQVDLLINGAVFAALIGLISLAKALFVAPWRDVFGLQGANVCALLQALPWQALGSSLVGFLVAWGFYLWAVASVPAWGEFVMTAFDCYLPALAKQLGFDLPKKGDDRVAFWNALSQMLVYRRDPAGVLPFYPEEWSQSGAAQPHGEKDTPDKSEKAVKVETSDGDNGGGNNDDDDAHDA
jgi:hypothetical protein